MSLRSYLEQLQDHGSTFIGLPSMPQQAKITPAVGRLLQACEKAGDIDIENPDYFVDRILQFWDTHHNIDQLSRRDFRACSRLLHQPGRSGRRLVDERKLVTALLARVRATWPQLAIRNLTHHYLEHYDPEHELTAQIFDLIKAAPSNRRSPLLQAMFEHGLVERPHRIGMGRLWAMFKHELMDHASGPAILAHDVLTADDSVDSVLKARQLTDTLAQSAFVERSFVLACDMTRSNEPDETRLFRLLDWAEDPGSTGQLRERFPKQTTALAAAVLDPWADTTVNPGAELEVRIKNLMLGSLGDPRFPQASGRWVTIPTARDVIKRWLNRVALTQFFEIVSRSMDTTEEKRMWRSRRRFWNAYLEYIEDAWVVFHTRGTALAKQAALASEDESFRQHGRFSTGGIAPTHACLLIKIGDLILAEWSHNGKCRSWPYDDDSTPKLYQENYPVGKLKDGEWEQIHHGDKYGSWQNRVAQHIRHETGAYVDQSVYYDEDNPDWA